MAFRSSLEILLAFYLICSVLAAPAKNSAFKVQLSTDEEKSHLKDLPTQDSSLHSATEKSTGGDKDVTQAGNADMSALQKSGQVLRLATLLPAESLRLLQMLAMPIVNTSIAVPANILEKAASTSPSEGLHEIGSLKQRAEVALHEKLLTPVSTFVGTSVNKSRSFLPTVFIGHISVPPISSLRHHFLVQQIDTLRKEISAERLRLKKTLLLLNHIPGIHGIIGRNCAAEENSVASLPKDATTARSLLKDFVLSHFREPEMKTPENISPESSISGSVQSEAEGGAKVKVAKIGADQA